MKGSITLFLLEKIKDAALNSSDLLGAFLTAGYGASYKKLTYDFVKRQSERGKRELQEEIRQNYYKLIYKLKKEGLIEADLKNNQKIWNITSKGKKKLSALKDRKKNELSKNFYFKEASKETNGKFIIVAFDIPEKDKRKRNWLREVLKRLGLKMIQKSLWMGKIKLPKLFLDDLKKLNLVDFVEIFEISKTGTLK